MLAQLAGEVVTGFFHLPIPGPVIGMLFVLGALLVRRGPSEPFDRTSRGLLEHLSLLFVPAGVGVMRYLDILTREGLAIGVTIVSSTVITMLVTTATMRALTRRSAR